MNQYFFDMANIREHCSWVHSKEQEAATAKAKDIVRMSVARAAMLEPLKEYALPVNKVALVVGGGVAGMTSARRDGRARARDLSAGEGLRPRRHRQPSVLHRGRAGGAALPQGSEEEGVRSTATST